MVESVYQNVAWLLQRIQSSSSSISNWLKREKKSLRYMKHDDTKKLRFIFITLLFRFIHRFLYAIKIMHKVKLILMLHLICFGVRTLQVVR